jgi:hypothetical protein
LGRGVSLSIFISLSIINLFFFLRDAALLATLDCMTVFYWSFIMQTNNRVVHFSQIFTRGHFKWSR